MRPEVSRFDLTAKDARNDPPLDPKPPDEVTHSRQAQREIMVEETKDIAQVSLIDPSKIAGSVKLPGLGMLNKSSLYTIRTKVGSANESDNNGAIDPSFDSVKCSFTSSDSSVLVAKSTLFKMAQTNVNKIEKPASDVVTSTNTFDNLSPNVKRMISSATETSKTNTLKFQKKTTGFVRNSVRGHRSNIPLVGATSKISQSGVEILPSVEIYDQPCAVKKTSKNTSEEDKAISSDTAAKIIPIKAEFRLETDALATYDVPMNNKPAIYDVPSSNNKTAFESLSLPYIDQSIELSITTNDREFDTKLNSKDNSPDKPSNATQESSPTKFSSTITNGGTNSLHRKDFVNKNESPSKPLKAAPFPESIGSTGNLKLYNLPEKEPERLQPPSVEVSRPLSMSSIASSSSTSSSGVQNKGGVNSAYLASIESLDDHSDADIPSADGSNNFVNNAGMRSVNASKDRTSETIPGN